MKLSLFILSFLLFPCPSPFLRLSLELPFFSYFPFPSQFPCLTFNKTRYYVSFCFSFAALSLGRGISAASSSFLGYKFR
ncbi:hypothetical protein RCL_jg20979.t1 [Rhizophagus clarus]|uniref:Uncharacterized protein n=1 Tax=Rhizophagus clarus TaxID=94130 RepID=A0A8H3LJ70_9GLOM|nr:hypothetical protein RCL_jg20979.t1 [Rhizophagus clarus]